MRNPLHSIPADQLKYDRRCGNTTRLVDHIVQLLYTYPNEPILIMDHFENGENENANNFLKKKLFERICNEHRQQSFVFKRIGLEERIHVGKFTITNKS